MKSYKPNQATILYLNSSFNCVKSSSITLALTSGGSGYSGTPTVIVTPAAGDAGYGASATATLTSGAITSITVTNNGTNYNKLPKISLSSDGTVTGYTSLVGGSGYLAAPNVTASGGGGSGFAATATITSGAVTSITITNAGKGYTSAPSLVFTPTNGGSGASATATGIFGTAAVITPSFLKTYNYSWNIPDVVINDLGRISAINLVASGFTTTTPYTFRIKDLQVDSRNSFYSDYGDPIISMVQNTNIANNDALGGESVIVLSSQTIKQIQLTVNDSLTTMNNGISSSINFIIALKIEEFDPTYTEIGNVYGESASRLKTIF